MRFCESGALALLAMTSLAFGANSSPSGLVPRPDSSPVSAAASAITGEPTTPTAGPQQPASTPQQQIELLKQQVEITRGFQSDMLLIVCTALGAVVALGALLVGYNWYTNEKRFESERQSMLQEVTNTAATQITHAEQTLRKEAQDERARTDAAMEALRTELRGRIEEMNSTLREHSDSAISTLSKKLTENLKDAEKALDRRIDYSTLRLTRYRLQVSLEEKDWGLAVTLALNQLKEAFALGSEFYIVDGLEKINTALDNGGKVTENELKDAPALFATVPVAYRQRAEATLEKIKNAEVI